MSAENSKVKSTKREIVKNIAIIFLVVMLILEVARIRLVPREEVMR